MADPTCEKCKDTGHRGVWETDGRYDEWYCDCPKGRQYAAEDDDG